MTTPSLYETTGIGISVWNPTIDLVTPVYTPRGILVDDAFSEEIVSYQHDIQANGGWWSAAIPFAADISTADDWFSNGINRHIEAYNPAGIIVWEGFVNQITVAMGTLTAVRGPLMDVANRGSVVYTPILDATTTPPIEGSETVTTIANNANSQVLYAILEEVVSGGKLLDDGTTDDAATLRDTYLTEFAWPETGESLDLTGGSEVTVTLDLLGYVHRFKKYIYEDLTAATVQVDAKIPLVIGADPNGMFSTDYTQIGTNALLASRYENDNRKAWDVLTELVSLGDAANNRYTLGVYNNRRITYAAVPTAVAYQHAITGDDIQIEVYGGSGVVVDPWDILPARWVFLTDFLIGQSQPTTFRTDPRYLFIESVRYTAPLGVQLEGQKVSRIPQMLAQLSG